MLSTLAGCASLDDFFYCLLFSVLSVVFIRFNWCFVEGLIWVCGKDIKVYVNANMNVYIYIYIYICGGYTDFWIRYECAEHGAQVARSRPK